MSNLGIPELTLGWDVLNWGSVMLGQPDGDSKGDRWKYTNEQALFVLNFYAVDENGRFIYRRGVLERPKGWGKSPFLAALCCTELLGPCRFSHFGKDGQAVGRPVPSAEVQIAAISEAQTDNTLSLVGEMLLEGPAARRYGLEVLLSKIVAPGNRKLIRVTASPRSREGNRPTFVVMDETHLWLPVEKGPELARTLRRNLAKIPNNQGRSIETTNAPVPGQESVAEMSWESWEAQEAGLNIDKSILLDSRQVEVEDIYDREQLMPALDVVYGDAWWIDKERIWAEINDPANPENDSRRFYLNQRRQDEAQWIKEKQWLRAERTGLTLKKSDQIALGFKGVTRNGAAALVACRLTDGALFLLGSWSKPQDVPPNVDWELPVARVDAMIRKYLSQDRTQYLVADPHTLQDVIGRISLDFPDTVEEFWLSQKLKHAKAVDMFESAFLADVPRIIHDGNSEMKWGMLNARTQDVSVNEKDPDKPNKILVKDKPKSKRYISIPQAALLAWYACQSALGLDEDPDNSVQGW